MEPKISIKLTDDKWWLVEFDYGKGKIKAFGFPEKSTAQNALALARYVRKSNVPIGVLK